MNLLDRMKKIAEGEGVTLDDVSLKRAEVFLREHELHDATEIVIGVGSRGIKYLRFSCGSETSFYSTTVYENPGR